MFTYWKRPFTLAKWDHCNSKRPNGTKIKHLIRCLISFCYKRFKNRKFNVLSDSGALAFAQCVWFSLLKTDLMFNLFFQEKRFLREVKSFVTNENIFILQNHWDNSDLDCNAKQVKKQHLDYCRQFLCEELRVMANNECADARVFFVSAQETLLSRLKDNNAPKPCKFMLVL